MENKRLRMVNEDRNKSSESVGMKSDELILNVDNVKTMDDSR